MTTMLRKMAEAMYNRAGERDTALFGCAPRVPFDQWRDQQTWFALADAALDALMKPTPEMQALDASLAPFWDHSTAPPTLVHRLGSHSGASFEDMIRAARAGK